VTPLKKYVHPGWEYSGLQDSTLGTFNNIELGDLIKLLEEVF
jgi:hypothetical protein